MCLDPSVTGFYKVSQKVSDVIPVLRLTPIATQPSAVSVFLLQDGPKVRKKSNFWLFLAFTSPISQWPLKIEACKQRMYGLVFDPHCRNPVKCVPRGKAIWNANGGFVSVLLTHLLTFISASLYVSKRGAYWDRLCRDVVGHWLVGSWLSRACTVAKRCILGL